MRKWFALAVVLLLALSCAVSLEQAAAKYRADREHQSLQLVASHLRQGMPRQEVERLLGPPDYSPTEGQYYYQSNRRDQVLVVDYRQGDAVSNRLQRFDFETAGE
jgi:outer membrane protein assembly factor BamE (lipoprotein component of BamABCDE complex)